MTIQRHMTFDIPLDDHDPPQPGDIITTARAAYHVTDARPVESRIWANRWHLTLARVNGQRWSNTNPPPHDIGHRVIASIAYRPGERPHDRLN